MRRPLHHFMLAARNHGNPARRRRRKRRSRRRLVSLSSPDDLSLSGRLRDWRGLQADWVQLYSQEASQPTTSGCWSGSPSLPPQPFIPLTMDTSWLPVMEMVEVLMSCPIERGVESRVCTVCSLFSILHWPWKTRWLSRVSRGPGRTLQTISLYNE